jgi:hypothetical protein
MLNNKKLMSENGKILFIKEAKIKVEQKISFNGIKNKKRIHFLFIY